MLILSWNCQPGFRSRKLDGHGLTAWYGALVVWGGGCEHPQQCHGLKSSNESTEKTWKFLYSVKFTRVKLSP